MKISKVLVANRGEIAVRIIRACQDVNIDSVAIYADSDRDAQHVELATEAYALGGQTATQTYLDIEKIIDIAVRSGADAVHPGYGFLAENADFARAVIAAGLNWIGPGPDAIVALGDKVSARQIAARAGAPLVAGTPDPVKNADEVVAFAKEHGVPIAIKAAFGGGGRGIKIAHTIEEIPALFESATREAEAAFGRGECFVERYLEKPRHVETQCLADKHGNVVVVSTRDCSLQRRHQKLVEEAPAPFLTDEQNAELVRASIDIMRTAGYVGAGTCEFLVAQDGTISFLEVNTRLQVEHPVTEEISGIDLVLEQLRIAQGEELGYDSVTTRGHSIEFRLNGEDPARNFLPAPGQITKLNFPSGPGVRIDAGVRQGDTISGHFDSMVAKLIVTGATREQAIARSKRALAELEILGIPTVVPFHRAVMEAPQFVAADGEFGVYTSWIETEFTEQLAKLTPAPASATAEEDEPSFERVVVEVGNKRLEVVLPSGLAIASRRQASTKPRAKKRTAAVASASGESLTSPMQGTIVKVCVAENEMVTAGQTIVILEAMKMEQPLTAHRDGKVSGLLAEAGQTVSAGAQVCKILDA